MASWIDGPTTFPEERSLDAHICKKLGQNNADAVYEHCLNNYSFILPAKVANSATWYGGPDPIPMRLDRDGLWRSPKIKPLAASTAAPTNRNLTVFVIPTWYEPDDDLDMSYTWDINNTATLYWETAQTISWRRGVEPNLDILPSGDEVGMVRYAYLVWQWNTGSVSCWFAGFHIEEQVD